MLDGPEGRGRFVENFAGQWLQLRNLDSLNPDPEPSPTSTTPSATRCAARPSCSSARSSSEDRSILDLLDADYTFLNERLAKHYGIDGVEGDEFRRVDLSAGLARGGILTQASILTITSNPTRTSPVKRGKWILEQILGTPAAAAAAGRARAGGGRRRARRARSASGWSSTAPTRPAPRATADGPARLRLRELRRHRPLARQDGELPDRRLRRCCPTARPSTARRS